MHANFFAGNSSASLRMSSLNRNPTPKISCASPAASWRIAASRSDPSPVSSVENSMPSSCLARSSPA
jgi:hypothetical protein